MFRHKEICHFIPACLGIVFILFISAASALAGTKTFIKEYAYQASEDDTGNRGAKRGAIRPSPATS